MEMYECKRLILAKPVEKITHNQIFKKVDERQDASGDNSSYFVPV